MLAEMQERRLEPFSTLQAAAWLGMGHSTVPRHTRAGLLVAVKNGGAWRLSLADVEHDRPA
jgi:excisionase family DNA binding protein